MCARRRSNFLLLRQKKVTKEKATLLRASPSLRYGATCDARSGGAPQNSLRAARSVQTAAASQCTKCVCPSAHARTPCPALLGTRRREPRERTSIRAIAALGPVSRAQAPRAAQTGPSAAMARVDVRLSKPLLAAPAAGRLRGGTRVGARVLRELTRRGCLNEAATQRSEFHGAPRNRHAAGLPLRTAKGSQTGGRLSFGYFSLAKQRKVPRPPGRLPASALNRGMRFNQRTKTNTTKSIATTAYPTSASSQKPLKQARKPSAPKK